MIESIIMTGIICLILTYGFVSKIISFNIYTFIGFIILSFISCVCVMMLSQVSATRDYEIWNGQISDKQAIRKNCETGWNTRKDDFCTVYDTREVDDPPICSTDSKGNQTCMPQSHTEYRYIYRWEKRYFVFADNLKKSVWEIDRIDRQGVNEPPKYTNILIGDPASISNAYTNWVKAASDSLFKSDKLSEDQYKDLIPAYPDKIYDNFKIDRVIGIHIPSDLNLKEYSAQLSKTLNDLGPKKQMNAIIVLADAKKADINLSYAIRRNWNGFKKNDAVIFIGLDDHNIAWVNVMSWSKESLFDVGLRDAILDYKNQDIRTIMPKILDNLHFIGLVSYNRREMKEFQYLANDIPIPISYYVLGFISCIVWAGIMIVINEQNKG